MSKKRKVTKGSPVKPQLGKQGAKQAQSLAPVTWRDWLSGARLRTLGLAIAPVAIGISATAIVIEPNWPLAILTLLVALFLQIGTNYANDYSDGIRGTDDHRVGPARLTGSGRVKPKQVLLLALIFFGLAASVGVVVVIWSQQWWLFAAGAAAILAGWFYTGGKRPYGYFALGEFFVFIFFGLAATWGTMYVQTGIINWEAGLSGAAIGAIAVAVLLVNNLRDIDQDKAAGKRTLSTFIGKKGTKILFLLNIIFAYLNVALWQIFYSAQALTWFSLALAIPAVIVTFMAKTAKDLITALQLTSFTGLSYGLLLGFGFFF